MPLDLTVLGPYALVVLSGLFAHACFQLTVSMLTLTSSHAIGAHRPHATVMSFAFSYVIGALLATLGLLVLIMAFFATVLPPATMPFAWIVVCALIVVVGWLTLLFYYRKSKGTRLWLPRSLSEAISARAKHTRTAFDALALGMLAVVTEFPFLIAPLSLAGAILSELGGVEKTVGTFAYSLAACSPLILITVLIGGGHKISTIQRWRETNKYFLQWTSGLTLILLGVYLFVTNIWGKVA